jgi:hypothetical protein
MSDIAAGILGTACVCSLFIIFEKLCSLRSEVKDISPEFLLIRKDHYDFLCKNSPIEKQPILPNYSEVTKTPSAPQFL